MQSRERFLATLNHREPDRVAAPGGGFILATTDAIMQESAFDKIMTMIKTCHEFNRYPTNIC